MAIVISGVILLALVGLLFFFLYRRNHPKGGKSKSRQSNAGSAVAAARNFARGNDYRIIAPANLARNGRFANLDAVVVGDFGVLGVKALGYNGNIYGSGNDAEWLQVSPSEQRTHFPNPITEAAADVRVIRDALFAQKLKTVPVEVLVVFTDPKVQLALPRALEYYTMKTFKRQLKKEKYEEEKGLDLDAVEKAIRDALVEK